jgi:hypothetical protein
MDIHVRVANIVKLRGVDNGQKFEKSQREHNNLNC